MESKQRRKTCSGEFKQEAVRLVRESGQSLACVSRDLGIDQNSLRKWKRAKESHIRLRRTCCWIIGWSDASM